MALESLQDVVCCGLFDTALSVKSSDGYGFGYGEVGKSFRIVYSVPGFQGLERGLVVTHCPFCGVNISKNALATPKVKAEARELVKRARSTPEKQRPARSARALRSERVTKS